jgi:hypothetical protein
MNERERKMEEWMADLREGYHPPPETPREEMWAAIESRIQGQPRPSEVPGVIPLEPGQRRKRFHLRPVLGWAAAAAAVLVLGLGIGRMTAPAGITPTVTPSGGSTASTMDPLTLATVEHLARTESLLTLVKADANSGRVESGVEGWARRLLTQTRLLMDAQGESDPVIRNLLEDLELILAQVAAAANANGSDLERTRTEMNLALDGLEDSEVIPRIQAVLPQGPRFLGT